MRTVSVRLALEIAAYIANAAAAERKTKDLRNEIARLDVAGSAMTKAGLVSSMAALPAVIAPAAAAAAALPAIALTGAAAMGTLALATNGVGTAMSAVAEGDSESLFEAMSKLTVEAREFVAEYQRVKPALDAVGDRTQSAFFEQLNGNLEQLTSTYLPVLLRQMPAVATGMGSVGKNLAEWATMPGTVGKVNRQFETAVVLVDDLGRMLRAGTAVLLNFADAGRTFTKDTVGGLADGVEALERWVAAGRATGQLDAIFENGGRIIRQLGEFAAQAAVFIADVADNPSLVHGAEALFDVLGLGLKVVHGLLTVFEALPAGLQSGIVTMAVYGGAVLLVTGRILAMKAALDQATISARTNAAALKGVGGMLGGPWGIAIGAATIAVTGFAMQQAAAKARVHALAGTLDEQTGAFTENTRAMIANELETNRTLQAFAALGVSGGRVVDAVMGDVVAMNELTAAVAANRDKIATESLPAYDMMVPALQGYARDLDKATASNKRETEAAAGSTAAINGQISAMQMLSHEIRKQTEPMFAMISAQQDLTSKQKAYNVAVKEHGVNSAEARAASLDLARTAVELTGAAEKAAQTFGGRLSPELRATLMAADLTAAQIAEVEVAFREAAKAAAAYEGNYNANVSVTGADAAIAKAQHLLNLIRQLGSASAAANFNSGAGYVSGRRWGGIDYAMAGGGTIPAHIATRPTILFGERETGDEAFVPRLGPPARALNTLTEAAGWYGHRIMPAGGTVGGMGGGTTTQVIVHEHHHTVTLSSPSLMSGIRERVLIGGGSVQKVFGIGTG